MLTTVYLKEKIISMAKNTNKMALPQRVAMLHGTGFGAEIILFIFQKSEANCFVEVMISFIVRSRAYFYCSIKIKIQMEHF